MKCPDCKGSGYITLLYSSVPCEVCGATGLQAPPAAEIPTITAEPEPENTSTGSGEEEIVIWDETNRPKLRINCGGRYVKRLTRAKGSSGPEGVVIEGIGRSDDYADEWVEGDTQKTYDNSANTAPGPNSPGYPTEIVR